MAQAAQILAHDLCDSAQDFEGRISFASFNPAHVAGCNAGLKRQILLREFPRFSRVSNSFAEHLH